MIRGECIRVTGTVQGVGLRPTVWRLARECGVCGEVSNDGEGVLVHAWGEEAALDRLVERLRAEPPPLARIEAIGRSHLPAAAAVPDRFRIVSSGAGAVLADVAADAATCEACRREVLEPGNRRHRYPFTNCTHCGPRLSIVRAIPYDRPNTSMAPFPMCPRCRAEYESPADRRFHAQPNACPDCGPRAWLEDPTGARPAEADVDCLATAARLLRDGHIVAVKGIGGFHLACDAASEAAVQRLRERKHRCHKALALMARDLDMVRRYATVGETEATLLADRAAPVVVLEAAGARLPDAIAPGQRTLGFMLPYTPLHHLIMQDLDAPLVMTSGNRSDEPQVIDNDDARRRLSRLADFLLLHDRDIVNRLDDSVLRVADGHPRFLRRARGYAPAPLVLGSGFADAGSLLAMGGEQKNTFCLLRDGKAIVSQHIGGMGDARTLRDYRRNQILYRDLFDHRPRCIAVDMHPQYLPTRQGAEQAAEQGVDLVEVQHHHAHAAACLAEHGRPVDAEPVLGVVLDGLGYGDDGTFWGGEFLLCGFSGYRPLARFMPVAMPGGTRAMLEPWRNTWAHLRAAFGWERVLERYGDLEMVRFLAAKPLSALETMVARGLNSPPASSCGRLFDAVAAALGVCRDGVAHEAQAAIELEALASRCFADQADRAYPCAFDAGPPGVLSWQPLWAALLDDLAGGVAVHEIAARFHHGLIAAVADVGRGLCEHHDRGTVALGGGVFQNRLMLEGVSGRLRRAGLEVLAPAAVPANDGGLSLGQAAVAAARVLAR